MFGHQQISQFGAQHLGFDAERRRGPAAGALHVPFRHAPLQRRRLLGALGQGDPG